MIAKRENPHNVLTRREVLQLGLGAALAGAAWSTGCRTSPPATDNGRVLVNDVHSRLNPTLVQGIHHPDSPAALGRLLRRANRADRQISLAGARHAMGGQQFGADTWLVELDRLNRLSAFNREARTVEVEAGIRWPKLMADLARAQAGEAQDTPGAELGIIQKQTGADELTLGGALAANIHGRGLTLAPIVGDIESFTLIDAEGRQRECSRHENGELFALAIGGYGLFGPVTTLTLRLQRRVKLRRHVEIVEAEQVIPILHRRIEQGCIYGDFQYSIDQGSDGFLTRGVLSAYESVPDDTPVPVGQFHLSRNDWQEMVYLAHNDPARAYERYTGHYLRTDGQIYWSDRHQLSNYDPHYHEMIDRRAQAEVKESEMITEIYVPRDALAAFLRAAAEMLRDGPVPVIYGTVRLIERDAETFLAWAREPFACVIFNLHCVHTPHGLAQAQEAFRDLIDLGIAHDGSYYLTYHRWARREQVAHCHPKFAEFLSLKRTYDPHERFQSDWYRHYRDMFG